MKKVLSLMLVICMLFTLAACRKDAGVQKTDAAPSAARQSDSGGDSPVSEETEARQEDQVPEETEAGQEFQVPEETGAGQEKQEIDVDLTQLSSTMVYSEVYNMINTPEDYIGKTVKMSGTFNLYCQKMDENGQPDFDYPFMPLSPSRLSW